MRFIFGLLLTLGFIGSARAGDPEELLDQVIAATTAGKPERLERLKTMSILANGTQYGNKAIREIYMAWPGTYRMNTELTDNNGDSRKFDFLIHKGQGFGQIPGQNAVAMNKEALAIYNEGIYVYWLSNLFPLKEKGVRLVLAPEIKLETGPAVGLEVTMLNRPKVLMYFDKKTHLHMKTALATEEGGEKILRELDFSKHKEVDGIKLPFSEVEYHKGVKKMEWTVTEIKLLDKLDPALLKMAANP